MTELPKITVITICRNALDLLRATADSVFAQQYPRLEYWVVDGASTDGTRPFLPELERRGAHVLSEPDRGITDAMNKGIGLATGELVAHLHAGDLYLPATLATVAEHWRRDPAADVFCGYIVKRETRGEETYRCDPSLLAWDMTLNHPATWIRRDVFERHGRFDERYKNAMDYELFLRLERAGCRFHVIPETLAIMDRGGQSERSLWVTLSETHAARRARLASGWQRSRIYLLAVYVRAAIRAALQRIGLGGAVRWYRRRFSLVRKG